VLTVSKWAFTIDIEIDTITGKRKQKVRIGFKNKGEAEAAADALNHELNQESYVEETDLTFCSLQISGSPSIANQKMLSPERSGSEFMKSISYHATFPSCN